MQQSIVKFYCCVVQTLLNMFRALLCPSSGARQTAVAASGFRMNVEVEVFSAVVCLPANRPRLTCSDLGFESHRGHGYLSVVSVVCCQVEVSATS